MSRHSPVTVIHKGSSGKTERLFEADHRTALMKILNEIGQMGVDALSAATPVRTGKTAASWHFEVVVKDNVAWLRWFNDSETESGDNIVRMLIRGHGTKNGHYYRAQDFVTPAITPITELAKSNAWAEVTRGNGKL